jgi:hypothetical protein
LVVEVVKHLQKTANGHSIAFGVKLHVQDSVDLYKKRIATKARNRLQGKEKKN